MMNSVTTDAFLVDALVAGLALAVALTALTWFRFKASGSAWGSIPVHFGTYFVGGALTSWFYRPFGEWTAANVWLFVLIGTIFGSLVFLIDLLEKFGKKTGAIRSNAGESAGNSPILRPRRTPPGR